MKATCIVGSARSNGSTAYLIDSMIRGLSEAGVEAKKHAIGEKKIGYCLGCKSCYMDGICVQQDDAIWRYQSQTTAESNEKNQGHRNRRTGGSARAGKRLILNSIAHYYGHLGIETVKSISICETDSLDDLKERHKDSIEEIYQPGRNMMNF